MHLSAVRVFVRDLAGAHDFYATKLGLPLTAGGAGDGYCAFGVGAADLIVEPVGSDAPQDDQALVGRFTGLSFSVGDALGKYKELKGLGVEFSGEPEQQFWGGILATFRDPAGNGLQIVQYPHA